MNFTSKEYLPDSGARIERLRNIINERPVAILAAGPSISELESRICELKDADICYFGLNNFSVQETHILQQIDKKVSVVFDACREDLPDTIDKIVDFLNRDEENLFISTYWRDAFGLLGQDFNLQEFISEYNDKLLFFSLSPSPENREFPNTGSPLHFNRSNSLLVMIQLAIIGKASKIILFGADGYSDRQKNNDSCHYRQEEYMGGPVEGLIHDTKNFNSLAPVSIKNIYRTYNTDPTEILNCSENSALTPFPVISYDNAFNYINTGENYDRRLDLRVPIVSIVSVFPKDSGYIDKIIGGLLNQSYTNYEHIIIYDEEDGKIRELKELFPFFVWASCKNSNYIQALKEGLSRARGEYIIHRYDPEINADTDWIGSCVEILEDDTDISLVSGIRGNFYTSTSRRKNRTGRCQDNPPFFARNYIYYWLNKKAVFPETNACIRKDVFRACFPFDDSKTADPAGAWISFNYCFNTCGYQPAFIHPAPGDCNYSHDYNETSDPKLQKLINEYVANVNEYKKQLFKKKNVHHYRNGSGELSPDGFNPLIYFYLDAGMKMDGILPSGMKNGFEKCLQYWIEYRWKVLAAGFRRCRQRLKKNPESAL